MPDARGRALRDGQTGRPHIPASRSIGENAVWPKFCVKANPGGPSQDLNPQ